MKQLHLVQVQSGLSWKDEKPDLEYVYKVEKVINSTSPRIGEQLVQADADCYCRSEEWNVTIK